MSDTCSENERNEEEEEDSQMAFVVLLSDYKILFDKRQIPAVKREKERAAEDMALAYSRNINKSFTVKQVMKKFNNMKTKVKAATDRKRTGNKKIVLSQWQKRFYDLWNEGENLVLNKVPGAMESGYQIPDPPTSSGGLNLPPPPIKKKRKLEEPEEFRELSLQELQRTCLIEQIKKARAQEKAANAMYSYYTSKNADHVSGHRDLNSASPFRSYHDL